MRSFTILVLSLILILSGCISFSIRTPDIPANYLEEISVCRRVDTSKDPWRLEEISSIFTLQDSSVTCYVKIRYVEQEIKLQWKWYSPQNRIIKNTGEVTVNSEKQYLDEVKAFDIFRFEPETAVTGKWTVAFFINDRLAGKRTFHIQEEGSDPQCPGT